MGVVSQDVAVSRKAAGRSAANFHAFAPLLSTRPSRSLITRRA